MKSGSKKWRTEGCNSTTPAPSNRPGSPTLLPDRDSRKTVEIAFPEM